MDISRIKNLYNQSRGEYNQIQKQIKENVSEQEKLKKRLELVEKAQVFLQSVAQRTQERLKFQIEDIVNLALESVFPDEYEFKIVFDVSRGKTDAELVFTDKRTGKTVDPMEASGGGVVDLTAFALRISAYALENGIDNVIILDEPFKFISRDLQERAGEILKTLSKKMGLQVLMVTHIPEFIDVADKVFEVRKDADGVSIVSERS